jgi:hypothetical protein
MMRWILAGLICANLGCAVRTGSGALSASNVPLAEGYMPKTRDRTRACSWRLFSLVPIGKQTSATDLAASMARGANGLSDIVIENETFSAFLFSANCATVTATPVTTGGSSEQ